jgi:hypothetical protein
MEVHAVDAARWVDSEVGEGEQDRRRTERSERRLGSQRGMRADDFASPILRSDEGRGKTEWSPQSTRQQRHTNEPHFL